MNRKYNKKLSVSKEASVIVQELEDAYPRMQLSRALSHDAISNGGGVIDTLLRNYDTARYETKKQNAKIARDRKKLMSKATNTLYEIRDLMGENWILETLSN